MKIFNIYNTLIAGAILCSINGAIAGSLEGISPSAPQIQYTNGFNTPKIFDAARGVLTIDASPSDLTLKDSTEWFISGADKNVNLTVSLDGTCNVDLLKTNNITVVGEITSGFPLFTPIFSGIVLAGDIVRFNSGEVFPTSQHEVEFNVTRGYLVDIGEAAVGDIAGTTLTLENSSYPGNCFSNVHPNPVSISAPAKDWGGKIKGTLGLLPPPPLGCDISVDLACFVEPKPQVDIAKCRGKLQQFTVAWANGSIPENITVAGDASVNVGLNGEITVVGPFKDNNVVVSFDGGKSVFHVSCSDEDFNSSDDCDKAAGDGKNKDGKPTDFINDWTLEKFVDAKGAILNCSAASADPNDGFVKDCIVAATPVNCATPNKPKDGGTLTFKYTAGTCADSTTTQGSAECSGTINPAEDVVISVSGGATATADPALVSLNQEFTISGFSRNNTVISLSNSGGTQSNNVHVSCSQDLNGGDIFGSITLIAANGQSAESNVTYRYIVENIGDPLHVVMLNDTYGCIAGVDANCAGGSFNLPDLVGNNSATFFKDVLVTESSFNTAIVSGLRLGIAGETCEASDIVKVTVVKPSTGKRLKKGSRKRSRKGSKKGSRKGSKKGSRKGSRKGSIKGSKKGSKKGAKAKWYYF